MADVLQQSMQQFHEKRAAKSEGLMITDAELLNDLFETHHYVGAVRDWRDVSETDTSEDEPEGAAVTTLEAANVSRGTSRRIMIDFDNTLTRAAKYVDGIPDVAPSDQALKYVPELYRRGYELNVLTARNCAQVAPWLATHGLAQYFTLVTNTKLPAVAYIDDRMIPANSDWVAEIERREQAHE